MFPIRVKTVQESDLRMLGSLARNIQRVLPVTQADIDAAAALGKGWVVWKVFEVSDPLDNLRGGTQLIIRQNSIQPGQNVRRVIFVAGPGGQTVVIRGTDYIVLPDAIANSLSYVKAFGGTEQNGTPTPDAPMDIVSNNGALKYSANMANVNAQTALVGYYISASGVVTADSYNWIYQDYIPVSPNTTYTLTMSSPVYYVSISEYSTASDSGFVIRKAGSSGANTTFTITTGATTNFIRFGANLDRTRITLEAVLAINWQLNTGNSMPYQPYVAGGLYTDGTVETINAHSKNLLDMADENIVIGKYINSQGAEQNDNANFYNSKFIPVSPNTIYTWSTSTSVRYISFMEYDSSKTFLRRTLIGSSSTPAGTSGSITLTANTAFVLVGSNLTMQPITLDAVKAISWQFEEGATATEYHQYYDGGTATAEMLLKIGDYTDVQEILSGAITRKVGVLVLDGTENLVVANQTYIKSDATDAYFNLSQAVSGNTVSLCNQLKYSTNSIWSSVGFPDRFRFNNKQLHLNVNNASLGITDYTQETTSSANAKLKAWLAAQYNAGTPVIIVYPLATPTTESVTGQTLQVTDGDNVLEITQASLTGLELEAQYNAAVSLTIQEVQDANLDNNVTVTIQ